MKIRLNLFSNTLKVDLLLRVVINGSIAVTAAAVVVSSRQTPLAVRGWGCFILFKRNMRGSARFSGTACCLGSASLSCPCLLRHELYKISW